MFKAALRPLLSSPRPVLRSGLVHQLPRAGLRRTLISTRFTEDHEYIQFDSDTSVGVVGITDYAQQALGDVVFVEAPAVDATFAQGDLIGAVESVKAASDIYAPVSGQVVAVNEALGDKPSLLNKSPMQDGWLCKVKLNKPEEFDALMTEEAYKAHIENK